MTSTHGSELTHHQRTCGMLVGASLVALALFVLYAPPTKLVNQTSSEEGDFRMIRETQDTSGAFIAVFIGGLATFGFSLNGLRFTRISAGGVVAESHDAGSAAQEYADTPESDRDTPQEFVVEDESPEVFAAPVRLVDFDDGTYAVYSLEAVPVPVLKDALSSWPDDNLPTDLGHFEFAARKTGRGNHAWTVKFRNHRPVVVSYGGQGKKRATVAQPEDARSTLV